VTSPTRLASGTRQILKSAYHATRNFPDRILHRRRHRAILQRVSQRARPRKILVVCYGNVCRSPYLQAVLQRDLPDLAVRSAGFVGSNRPVPQISLALSAERGLDLSAYRSRPLTQSVLSNTELIIVMDSNQARQIEILFPANRALVIIAGDLDPQFEASRGIQDPWNLSRDVFESSFNRLDRCASVLVRILHQTK
jgi:protein-tyrosine phosphatase